MGAPPKMAPSGTNAKLSKILGVRHVQFVMLFFAALIAYGMRTNMSLGIIAMMDRNPPNPDTPTFPDWTQKNLILSSFFIGYVIPQIGAGQLIKNFGPKWFLAATFAINSLFSLLIPVMASALGEGGVIMCRVIQGLTQGFLFPSIHNLLGRWTPLAERSTIASFVYTGGPLGTVISMPVTGTISNTNAGWPAVFYLYGALGLCWAIVWAWVGSNCPEHHKSISLEERRYIEGDKMDEEHHEVPTPWRDILTSLPVWAVVVSHIGMNWGFWTLMTEIPSYLNNIMGYDIQDNSLISALPYLALWILSFIFSPIADFLIVREYLSIGAVRKIFNSIGLIVPAIALTWLAFVPKGQSNLAIALLIVAVGINSAVYCGFNVNHIDLSPIHAGTLMGITNSTSNVFSIVAPLAIDAIGLKEEDPDLWKIVFLIAAVIYVVTDVFFVIFASGEVQHWNDKHTQQSHDKDIAKAAEANGFKV